MMLRKRALGIVLSLLMMVTMIPVVGGVNVTYAEGVEFEVGDSFELEYFTCTVTNIGANNADYTVSVRKNDNMLAKDIVGTLFIPNYFYYEGKVFRVDELEREAFRGCKNKEK